MVSRGSVSGQFTGDQCFLVAQEGAIMAKSYRIKIWLLTYDSSGFSDSTIFPISYFTDFSDSTILPIFILRFYDFSDSPVLPIYILRFFRF